MKANISPEPALLGFLLDKPMHGYDLYRRVKRELGPVWHLGQSQMYAIVSDYAARGWIRTRVEHQGTRPAKKILALTASGRRAFDAWIQEPAHGLREFRVDFFARLYFARAVGRRQLDQLLDQQVTAIRRELAALASPEAGEAQAPNEFLEQVRRFRFEQLSATLKWIEGNRRQLAQLSRSVERRKSPRVRASARK